MCWNYRHIADNFTQYKNQAKYVGAGTTRRVYRIGLFAYKVMQDEPLDGAGNNESEYETYFRLPRWHNVLAKPLYLSKDKKVLVMRYFDGKYSYGEEWDNWLEKYGDICDDIGDVHENNVIFLPSGKAKVVDFAYPKY